MPNADKHLNDTINALEGDVTTLDTATAIEMLETWQAILEQNEFDGSDDLHGLLVQLQSQLEADEPDEETIAELLGSLADATQDAADLAEDEYAGRLQILSDLLGDTSTSLGT